MFLVDGWQEPLRIAALHFTECTRSAQAAEALARVKEAVQATQDEAAALAEVRFKAAHREA